VKEDSSHHPHVTKLSPFPENHRIICYQEGGRSRVKHTAGKNLTSKSIVIPHVRTWWPASPVGYGVGAGEKVGASGIFSLP